MLTFNLRINQATFDALARLLAEADHEVHRDLGLSVTESDLLLDLYAQCEQTRQETFNRRPRATMAEPVAAPTVTEFGSLDELFAALGVTTEAPAPAKGDVCQCAGCRARRASAH